MSRFPVHQDGSCNGLQHYAALGRDRAGAESVNLCPNDVPSDVYSDVVELVGSCSCCRTSSCLGNSDAEELSISNVMKFNIYMYLYKGKNSTFNVSVPVI